MKQEIVSVDDRNHADPPKRRGAPLASIGFEIRSIICQTRPHIVQQQIRERMNRLMRNRVHFMRSGLQGLHMACATSRIAKERFALLQGSVRIHAPVRNRQGLAVKDKLVEKRVGHFRIAAIG